MAKFTDLKFYKTVIYCIFIIECDFLWRKWGGGVGISKTLSIFALAITQ